MFGALNPLSKLNSQVAPFSFLNRSYFLLDPQKADSLNDIFATSKGEKFKTNLKF